MDSQSLEELQWSLEELQWNLEELQLSLEELQWSLGEPQWSLRDCVLLSRSTLPLTPLAVTRYGR